MTSNTINKNRHRRNLTDQATALPRYFEALLTSRGGRAGRVNQQRKGRNRTRCSGRGKPRGTVRLKTPFECLLFEIRHVRFAIPCDQVRYVVTYPVSLKTVANVPLWYLGNYIDADDEIAIIDLAPIVVERKSDENEPVSTTVGGSIVVLESGRIGLKCQRVFSITTIDPVDVCWRSRRTRRRWLAGVARGERCALLDLQAIHDLWRRTGTH
jgi:chemotaxis signal transduction protein